MPFSIIPHWCLSLLIFNQLMIFSTNFIEYVLFRNSIQCGWNTLRRWRLQSACCSFRCYDILSFLIIQDIYISKIQTHNLKLYDSLYFHRQIHRAIPHFVKLYNLREYHLLTLQMPTLQQWSRIWYTSFTRTEYRIPYFSIYFKARNILAIFVSYFSHHDKN